MKWRDETAFVYCFYCAFVRALSLQVPVDAIEPPKAIRIVPGSYKRNEGVSNEHVVE